MPLDAVMIAITELGSPQSITILAVMIVLFLITHRKPQHFMQFVIFMSLGAVSVWAFKLAIHEPRPITGLIVEEGYGFPSGHAAMSTLFAALVVYAYISHIETKIGKYFFILLGIFFAGAISYSRIYLGVHSWLDVAGGITLGAFWFFLSVIFYTHLKPRHSK